MKPDKNGTPNPMVDNSELGRRNSRKSPWRTFSMVNSANAKKKRREFEEQDRAKFR